MLVTKLSTKIQTAHGRSKAVTVLYFHMNCMLYYKKFKIPGVYGVAVGYLASLALIYFDLVASLALIPGFLHWL